MTVSRSMPYVVVFAANGTDTATGRLAYAVEHLKLGDITEIRHAGRRKGRLVFLLDTVVLVDADTRSTARWLRDAEKAGVEITPDARSQPPPPPPPPAPPRPPRRVPPPPPSPAQPPPSWAPPRAPAPQQQPTSGPFRDPGEPLPPKALIVHIPGDRDSHHLTDYTDDVTGPYAVPRVRHP